MKKHRKRGDLPVNSQLNTLTSHHLQNGSVMGRFIRRMGAKMLLELLLYSQ